MGLSIPYWILPGLYDLKNKRYGTSAFWFVLFILPFMLIISNFSLFVDGLVSFGVSLFIMLADWNEFNKIFNAAIIEYWIASLFVIFWASGIVLLHRRSIKYLQSQIDGEISYSQWRTVGLELRKNRVVLFFIFILTSLYIVAFLCPWLSPYDPNAQQDIVVTKYAAPFQKITYLKLRPEERSALPLREGEGMTVAGINKLIILRRRLLEGESPVLYVNSFQKNGNEVQYVQGIQSKKIAIEKLVGVKEEEFAGGRKYLLGSDKYGRDIFSRLIYGSRISLSIGLMAMLIAVTLGTVIGALAGYFGKRTDAVLMRWVDLMLAFPNLFLILMIVALFGNSIILIVVILGLTGWMGVSRIVRGQFLALRETEYIQAAHALGFGHTRIIFKHLIPNAFAPVIVAATLRLGGIILVEAGLSFLGVGVQPPTASWGNMVAEGRDTLINAWWISTFPGLAIVLTVISFNMIGDGLRDALDPRLKT
jgi:peptide/nickel transport system permease protein